MKKIAYFFFFLAFSGVSLSASANQELKQIQNEMKKVKELIDSGNSTSELRSYLSDLEEQSEELEKKVKSAKKEVKSRPPVLKRRSRRLETIYSLDSALSVKEQYDKAKNDLKIETTTWINLNKSFKNGASYLKGAIVKTEQKIEAIKKQLKQLEIANINLSEKESKIDLKSGMMLDAYYMYNLNSPNGGAQTSFRNYDKSHNDFTMNLVEFNFTGSYKDYGFYVDLDFGEFADQNSGNETDKHIGQAFLTYEENGYLFTFGKMYTNVGYEVAKSQENWNYSRSFVFSNSGPFWHEGLSLTKSYDNGLGWGLYLYDQWDSRAEQNNEKTYSAQLNYSSDNFSIIYNYISGAESRPASNKTFVHETNMQYNWSENFALAFNAVFRTDENTGSASGTTLRDRKRFGYVGYLHYKTKRWSFTPRIEFFTDENTTETAQDGVALAKDDLKFTSYTFTTSYAFRSNTELRLEFRSDQANQNFYVKDGNTQKGQNTLSLAWLMSY